MRFCFARDRKELTGALASMKQLFGTELVDSRESSRESVSRKSRLLTRDY